jgi:hypothetical protein
MRLFRELRPGVLGSCHEALTDRILFLVPVTRDQRIAACSWFPPRTITGWRPAIEQHRQINSIAFQIETVLKLLKMQPRAG